MIKVKANIVLFKGFSKRKTAFLDGYRPLFEFIKGIKISGKINLINQNAFKPEMEGIVEITFLNANYLGAKFKIGSSFKFYEAKEILGEGEIIDIDH